MARAVIFAQVVDDPSEYVDLLLSDPATKRAAQRARRQRRMADDEASREGRYDERAALRDIAAEREHERLFGIVKELVRWENTTNETVLEQARAEIWQSWRRACAKNADHPRALELFDRHQLPAFHDPFAGGGALPLEAQRLGLETHASDRNPVAVLINKAMIEIPPRFAGRPPVNPEARGEATIIEKRWQGAHGLAEDVRHYGRWMRNEAEQRIGHLYPSIEITTEIVLERPDLKPYRGRKLTIIAWLWERTVRSPNPAFADVEVPLASTFMLSTKKGREAYVEPVIEGRAYRFRVRTGPPANASTTKRGTKSGGSGSPFLCLVSGSPMPFDYLRAEGKAGRLGSRLLAVVAEGDRKRVYLTSAADQELTATDAKPEWMPETELPQRALGFRVQEYGMLRWCDLFTSRQLVALTTFADLAGEATERIRRDAVAAGMPDDARALHDGGTGATAYAEAVSLYLGAAVSKETAFLVTQARGRPGESKSTPAFGRQAVPMIWDYADLNPFAGAGGDFFGVVEGIEKTLRNLPERAAGQPVAAQADAASRGSYGDMLVSTDPPYYDNIGYADLSDFFYVRLRRSMKPVFPELFATVAVPKAEELVAQRQQPARPVLRAAAGLHSDQARRVIGEVLQELRPRQPHVHELARLQFDPAQLKHSLRDIHADDGSGNLHLGPFGCLGRPCVFPPWHFDAVGPRGSTSDPRPDIRNEGRPFHSVLGVHRGLRLTRTA